MSAKGRNEFTVKGFKNKQALNNHWTNGRTHRDEYIQDGITTVEQYQARALELVQSPADGKKILGYKTILQKAILKRVYLQCLSQVMAGIIMREN